jgi:hypothetical protein
MCIPIFDGSEVSEESVRGMLRKLIEEIWTRRGIRLHPKCVTPAHFFSKDHRLIYHHPTYG